MEGIKDLRVNLEAKILQSEKVIIVPHLKADFDAIGSAIGISLIAKKLKKASIILLDDTIYNQNSGVQLVIDEVKDDFSIVTKETYLQQASSNDLFILTDVNKNNLICLEDMLKDEKRIVIIDHHEEGKETVNSDYKYINCNVSSASEIVTKLLNIFKIKPNADVANYLLAGIYLDTNRLQKNINEETMKTVATLMKYGADMNKVIDWFAEDFYSDRRVQELVSKAQITTYSIATVLAEEGMEYTKEELAKVADYLLKFRVDAAFAIGNIGDDTISISARSKGKINVGQVMQELNGGGNQHSAATKLKGITLQEANKQLLKVIKPKYSVN